MEVRISGKSKISKKDEQEVSLNKIDVKEIPNPILVLNAKKRNDMKGPIQNKYNSSIGK